jgi:hypothetical protein
MPSPSASSAPSGAPTAAELLAKTQVCNQISKGSYLGAGQDVICGSVGAIWFKADMDIDCDGQTLGACPGPDPTYFDDTSCHQSDGKPLAAAILPYVVIPLPDAKFNYHQNNIQCGAIVAVIYKGQVEYAVFGDEGPTNLIGEASYATAVGLGIDPNPATGGASGGVTYIVFPGSHAKPIEDHQSAVDQGQVLARQFINQN